jgi:hypothetical protein
MVLGTEGGQRVGYDIIGDIHGSATKLEALLKKMGYQRQSGAWRCADRTAIFVGDFVDRGPYQLATIQIVREMVGAGSAQAIMGNHEFNAIAFATRRSDGADFCRTHVGKEGGRNRQQHACFLAEVKEESDTHRSIIDWFLELPLWLDLDGLRIVHACWNDEAISWLSGFLHENRLNASQIEEATSGEHNVRFREGGAGTPAFRHIETLLKGVEVGLPKNAPPFRDADGHERDSVRVRWWDSRWKTYAQAALLPPSTLDRMGDHPLPEGCGFGYEASQPVFIGHYWLRGTPQLLAPKVACVDYSAGVPTEPLVAYRWDGEQQLHPGKFISSH